jgi:hypothetical protein
MGDATGGEATADEPSARSRKSDMMSAMENRQRESEIDVSSG